MILICQINKKIFVKSIPPSRKYLALSKNLNTISKSCFKKKEIKRHVYVKNKGKPRIKKKRKSLQTSTK